MIIAKRPLPLTVSYIAPSEVEASIKRLNCSKAPGEDNIIGGFLQDGGDAMIQVLTDSLFNTCLASSPDKNIQECFVCFNA